MYVNVIYLSHLFHVHIAFPPILPTFTLHYTGLAKLSPQLKILAKMSMAKMSMAKLSWPNVGKVSVYYTSRSGLKSLAHHTIAILSSVGSKFRFVILCVKLPRLLKIVSL